MHYFLKLLKHLFTATNQYGVHSPFVYHYLTKCLYKKSTYKGSKSEKALLKSIAYFPINTVRIEDKNVNIERSIQEVLGKSPSNTPPFDLIYCDALHTTITSIKKENIHNDSMVFLNNIYQSTVSTATWETLLKDPKITVSIDFFYCGVLFFRREQVKQHFKIRI